MAIGSAKELILKAGDIFKSKLSVGVLWNVASLGILAAGGIIINFIIVLLSGNEALGVFNQIYSIYIVLSQIGVGGVQFSALKHIAHHQTDLEACGDITVAALLLVVALTPLIYLVVIFLLMPSAYIVNKPLVGAGLWLVLPGLLFFSANKVLINVLNGLSHMRAYAVFRSLRYIFIPIAIVVILLLKRPIPELALSLSLTEILLSVLMLVYIYGRVLPVRLRRTVWKWIPVHAAFGARGALSGILIELNTRIDVLMLGYFTTDALVGVYSFAATLAEGFKQLSLAVRWNIDPLLGGCFARGETGKIDQLAVRIKRVFLPLMSGVTLVALAGYPLLLYLSGNQEFLLQSWLIFAIIMAGVLLNSAYNPFSGILIQGGRPGAFTFMTVGLVVGDALLNLVFIPWWGINGAALVTALTYCAEAVLLLVLSRRLFGVKL